ncbi:hypothetical protein BAE44_0012888 [Dichanthelium oligosanthes]|uniref:MATH domain-containing protein n=1 Tax=Dichanthelium oligosanthes TaxID=888268 RepID=A0A1E5VM09_9POAL|nr:hypothetical protein BAE44_0012888 [Dichanthelium oligosanthes]
MAASQGPLAVTASRNTAEEYDYSDYEYYQEQEAAAEAEYREYISLYLEHVSGATEANVVFDFRLINPVTGQSSPEHSNSGVFNHLHNSRGAACFIKKSELEASYVGDDRLVIECGVIVILSAPVSRSKTGWEIQVPSSDMLDSLGKLQESGKRYAMERMKFMCESILCKRLDINNVATILAIADQHHCNNLKNACIEYISSLNRMDDVLVSRGYEHLKRTCPDVVMDLWETAAKSRRI